MDYVPTDLFVGSLVALSTIASFLWHKWTEARVENKKLRLRIDKLEAAVASLSGEVKEMRWRVEGANSKADECQALLRILKPRRPYSRAG